MESTTSTEGVPIVLPINDITAHVILHDFNSDLCAWSSGVDQQVHFQMILVKSPLL